MTDLLTKNDLTIRRRLETDNSVTLVAEGELDLLTSIQVREELLAIEALGQSKINLDLKGIHFLDSMGLSTIIGFKKRLAAGGRDLGITAASSQVLKVLTLLGLRTWFM